MIENTVVVDIKYLKKCSHNFWYDLVVNLYKCVKLPNFTWLYSVQVVR